MPKLNEKEYKCDWCGDIFQFVTNEEWNRDKALEEFNGYFPWSSIDDADIVCDDCWQKVKPDA